MSYNTVLRLRINPYFAVDIFLIIIQKLINNTNCKMCNIIYYQGSGREKIIDLLTMWRPRSISADTKSGQARAYRVQLWLISEITASLFVCPEMSIVLRYSRKTRLLSYFLSKQASARALSLLRQYSLSRWLLIYWRISDWGVGGVIKQGAAHKSN